jgi:hypothetical protein
MLRTALHKTNCLHRALQYGVLYVPGCVWAYGSGAATPIYAAVVKRPVELDAQLSACERPTQGVKYSVPMPSRMLASG